ncbi:MAG: alpha/beta hydrolase [Candidatus Nanopelagicales bacterium]|jgi:pimeloyl-ACP methyl ester carboxylesterase|nr:alpha/beta hydrolase [Candidatus Nanopelagicales bacterium]
MPTGHSVEDMAADYAGLIAEQFAGRVDTVLGVSYGGMILMYLAANHPECAEHFVAALAGGTLTDWGRDVDYRWAQARARGDSAEAGRVMAEYFLPASSQAGQRRLLGQVLRLAFSGEQTPPGDLIVEAEAEMAYDARDALPRISVPVLIIAAEEDMFFTKQIVDETEALIPGCTVVRYPGLGHMRAASSGRLVQDVLEYTTR